MKYLVIFFLVCSVTAVVFAGDKMKTTVAGYPAAATEELLDMAVHLSVNQDYPALQQMIDAHTVIVLRAGVQVQIIESKLNGKIKIRPSGSKAVLWTLKEAVK